MEDELIGDAAKLPSSLGTADMREPPAAGTGRRLAQVKVQCRICLGARPLLAPRVPPLRLMARRIAR